MQEFSFRIYGILEIKNQKIIFTIFKITQNQVINIFQKEIDTEDQWLGNLGNVKNPNLVALKIDELISSFYKSYPYFNLTKIALVVSSKFLKINLVSNELKVGKNEQKTLVTYNTISELQSSIWKPSTSEFELIDAKLTHWYLDGVEIPYDKIIGQETEKIVYETLTYEVPKTMISSYYQILELLNLDCLKVMSDLQSAYSFLSNQDINRNECIIANWENDCLELGYFDEGSLKTNVFIPEGFDFIINNLSKKVEISVSDIKNYLFNLVPFEKTHQSQQIICQKWDNKQKILRKYSLKTLKEMIAQELNKLYLKAYKIIESKLKNNDIKNHYHFGVIQQNPNLETLLIHFTAWLSNTAINRKILGFKNNFNIILGFGLAKNLELINRYSWNSIRLTSLGENSKVLRQHQPISILKSLNRDNLGLMFLKF